MLLLGVQAAGEGKKVNPWDIGCPDLASGGREDGLATTDQLRKQEQERRKDEVMEVWRKEGSKENINGQTETHIDFSSVSSEPNFTAAQEWIEMGGREKVPADPPRRNQHLCMKSFFDC